MWQATKLLLLLLSTVGMFVMENTPSGLRDNICSWEMVYPCPEWFRAAHVDDALQLLVWLLFVVRRLADAHPLDMAGVANAAIHIH